MCNVALSSSDIKNIFDGKINVYTYDEIKNFDSIDDLLYPHGRAIILYFWKNEPNKYGHWTACFQRPNNNIEFYDSFSSKPDKEFKDIPKNFRQKNGMDYPYLTRLLFECPYNVEYNDFPTQDLKSSCCGRYCVARIANADLSIDQFNKLFTKDKKRNDNIIVHITNK